MINERRREMCAPTRFRSELLADLAEEEAELLDDVTALRAGDASRVPPWMTLPEALQGCEERLEQVREAQANS